MGDFDNDAELEMVSKLVCYVNPGKYNIFLACLIFKLLGEIYRLEIKSILWKCEVLVNDDNTRVFML